MAEANIPDKYVDLLERSLEENKKLRLAIVKQEEGQRKILEDMASRINRQDDTDKPSRTKRRKTQKIVIPSTCRKSFRTCYTALLQKDDFKGFAVNKSFGSDVNQATCQEVAHSVVQEHGGQGKCPWTNAQLTGAGATYFKTKCDEQHRKVTKATEAHKTTCRRQGRSRDKLQRRLEMLPLMKADLKVQDAVRKVLTPEYTSSDESDLSEDEDGNTHLKGYLTKKLAWERTRLRKVKEELDAEYLKKLPPRSRRSFLPRRNHTSPSNRGLPNVVVNWAARQPSQTSLSLVEPRAHSTPKNRAQEK